MENRKSGYCVVSRCLAFVLFIAFIGSLLAVGLLVYFLADRPSPQAYRENADVPVGKLSSSKDFENVRLPRAVLPIHYDVRLLPILENGNFSIIGRVSIDVKCKEETDRIVLHSADIVVDAKSVNLIQHGKVDQNVAVDSIRYNTELEFLTVQLGQKGGKLKLVKGLNYTLSMDFVANLTDSLKGFYRSSYQENGVEKFLAVSQMEPTDARRAFPCFDEPNMKATFTVTLGRHRDMKSLSNMPLINSTAIEGMQDFFWDHFEKSVPMSTYLVAFVVADFSRVQADVANSKWGFNIYARPGAVNQTQYAREVGPKIQAFFEDYFQIPYPLPKQDMIAIPDFHAGAMENWGLITYRESALLYDEKVSSASNKESILSVIAHELAHQWFGNLVTMDWWTDLWLNEGFASYVQYLGAEFAEPKLKLVDQFVLKSVHGVMGLDALESSHPISIVVHHPDEIAEIFDGISYSKGATVIRMLADFLGENTFRQGLTNYLNSRRYGNAIQDDLWEAFTQQAKSDKVLLPASVKDIMDTWTLKMGFPVITVHRDYQSRRATLSQERFLMQRSNSSSDDKTVYLWWVPLTYTTDFKTTATAWIPDSKKSLSLDLNATESQWVIFNINQKGYYRVNYDSANWKLIAEQLKKDHTVINVINRAQVMNDALNLAQAGLLNYEIVFGLTEYLERETEYLPWDATLSSLGYVAGIMSRTSSYGLFKKHMKKLITPLYNTLGFSSRSNDSHLDVKLRINAVNWACSMGIKDCIENAKRSYSQWMADPENDEIIPPDMKRSIMCTAIRQGGDEEWDFAFSRYKKTNVANERDVILSSLSCSGESWILSKLLEMSLNSTMGIRRQDASRVISGVAGNPLGRYLAFHFIQNRWVDVKLQFTGSFSGLDNIISSVSGSFSTDVELKQLLEFAEDHKHELTSAARATQQSIDKARNNLNWMKKNYVQVVEWLQRNHS